MTDVLFICRHNAGRSQLAAGLLRARNLPGVTARSGGLEPAAEVNQVGAAALRERGIDISDQIPRRFTRDDLATADVIVTLVPGLELDGVEPGRQQRWSLPDPGAWDIDAIRPLVDAIDERIDGLVRDLPAER